jgi:hypothetical protein
MHAVAANPEIAFGNSNALRRHAGRIHEAVGYSALQFSQKPRHDVQFSNRQYDDVHSSPNRMAAYRHF